MNSSTSNKLLQNGIFILISCSILIGVLSAFSIQLIALVLVSALTLLAIVSLSKALLGPAISSETYDKFLKYLFVVFLFHFLVGLTIFHIKALENYLGSDASEYDSGALGLVMHWRLGYPMPTTLTPGKAGYFYMLASVYWIFGYTPNLGLVVNNALFSIAVIFLASVTTKLKGETATLNTVILAGFLPGFIIWSSQLLRESAVYLCLAISLWSCVSYLLSSRLKYISLAAFALVILLTMRSDVAFLDGAGLIIAIVYNSLFTQKTFTQGLGSAAGMLLLASFLVIFTGSVGYEAIKIVTTANLSTLNTIRQSSSTAASGFLTSANITSVSSAVKYLPFGLIYFLAGPFPWQIHSIRELPALPDCMLWWILIPFLFKGLKFLRKNYKGLQLTFTVPALALSIGLSLIIANFGTVVRERMQVILILLPVVAIGLTERRKTTQHSKIKSVTVSSVAT